MSLQMKFYALVSPPLQVNKIHSIRFDWFGRLATYGIDSQYAVKCLKFEFDA